MHVSKYPYHPFPILPVLDAWDRAQHENELAIWRQDFPAILLGIRIRNGVEHDTRSSRQDFARLGYDVRIAIDDVRCTE